MSRFRVRCLIASMGLLVMACSDSGAGNEDKQDQSNDSSIAVMPDSLILETSDTSVSEDVFVVPVGDDSVMDATVPRDAGGGNNHQNDAGGADAGQSDQGMSAQDAGTCTLTCAAWSQLNEVNCVCEEVDDCLDNNGGCHRNSTCVNNPSIYEPPACTCDEGEGYWPAGNANFETCRPFTVCTENEYETAAPTPTSDRECTALTQCPPGSPEVTPPTATSDRVCGVRNDPDGDGIFGLRGVTRTEILTGESFEYLAAADFDEDGDMDLVWYGGWLRNDSLPLKVDAFTQRDLQRSIDPDVELRSFMRNPIYATDFTPRNAATGPHSTDLLFVGRDVVISKNLGNESMRVETIETVQDVYDPRVTKWLTDDAQDLLFYKTGGSDLRLVEPTFNGTYTDSLLIEDVRHYQICGANEGQRGVIYVDNTDTYWATMTSQSGGYRFQSTRVNGDDLKPHACGDFNGDGRSEALVQGRLLDRDAMAFTNHVYLLERVEGATTWTIRQFFDKQGEVTFAKAIDLEGDGDQDLIVSYAGPEIGDPHESFIYENIGNNEFNEIAIADLMDGEHQLPVRGIWTDFDGDGVVDVIGYGSWGIAIWRLMWNDNCPSIANPDQADLNNDHRGDPCSFDVDLDTVHDRVDNCRNTQNTDQSDLDADGIGDACDPDIDGDGIRNVRETLFGTNPELADSDGDGTGDFIELNCGDDGCPDEPVDTDGDDINDANDTDADNDGVLDGADNCRVHVNADQANLDGDTFGDSCDLDADGDLVEQGGDCDDLNPYAASLTWDSDCDGYADEIGKDRLVLRTYRSREREAISNGAVSSSENIWSSSRIAWRGEKIFTADIDGDGDIDVIPRDGYVYYNDGGPISTYPSYRLYNLYPEIDWVADLNADGYPEFIMTDSNGLTIYQNLHDFTQLVHEPDEEPWNQYRIDGAFSALNPVSYVNEAMQAACDSVWLIQTSGDLDGDGDEDFITTCTQNDDIGALAWHENQDNTLNFTSHLLLSGLRTPNTPHVVDFNGDGHRDIVFAAIEADPTRAINDGYVSWLRNDGAQNFTQSVLIPEIGDDFRFGTISYRQGKVSVAVADMDGDGDLDIITNTDGDVYGAEWWENDGGVDPILVDDHLIKVQPSIDDDEGMLGPFEVHDVDRDGLVDVVANYKYWFRQRPNGGFQTEYLSNGGEDMIFGAIDDVNGDGHLDVFVNEGRTRNDRNDLSWYRMYALDNCPDISNADQVDTDGNFVGDACEP